MFQNFRIRARKSRHPIAICAMRFYLNYALEIGMVMLLANQNAILRSIISQKQIEELISFFHADANSEN